VYLATTGGHVIKLIDTGSALVRPGASSLWHTDFTNGSVASITSPLVNDFTNLNFSGTDGANNEVFAVQITKTNMSTSEKALVKEIGPILPVVASPTAKAYNGTMYLFFGSQAPSSQAFLYRIDVSGGLVDASYSGTSPASTFSINDSLRLANDHLYAADDGGYIYKVDAGNFVGGFVAMTGFPYRTAAHSPIKNCPFVDAATELLYFGDNAGNLHVLNSNGTTYSSGFPYAGFGGVAFSSTPYYRLGVIAIGASDGFVYLVDRNTGSGNPNLFSRFYVGSSAVSSVAWNAGQTEYMVSTLDGKLSFIPFQADPTSPN
jgi:hypothetical protein